MISTTTTAPLAFQPWDRDREDAKTLKDVLARVNLERGHFRNITEAALQEEISAEGGLELSSSEEEDDEQDEEGRKSTKRKPPTSREELYTAKREMLEHVYVAHQDVMMSLDFVALLESKHAPSQGAVSMSPGLKQAGVPTGSLGTDLWDPKAMPVEVARQAQDNILASTVRMQSLQESADDLLAAATRLQDNVRKETVFWNQVLTVSETGWSVSKIYKHLLGVHFGFRGSGAEFAHRHVAALISDEAGNVVLERGVGSKPKAIRVILRKGHDVVGSSVLPLLPDQDEATLEAQIRHARDSVYDEELFHEMIREARTATSSGVMIKGASITFAIGTSVGLQLELDLVALDDNNTLPIEASHELDSVAKAVLLTARLLLGHAHRTRLCEKQDLPPPMAVKQNEDEDNKQLSILLPVMLLFKHSSEVSDLNTYMHRMSQLIKKSQVFVVVESARVTLATDSTASTTTGRLMESLTGRLVSEGLLQLTVPVGPRFDLGVTIETSRSISTGSRFMLQAPGEDKVEFSDIEDVFAAADDLVSLGLAHVLKSALGDEWILDAREGSLTKSAGDEYRDTLWFTVDHRSQVITMHSSGSNEIKEVVWKLEGSGAATALKDAWQDLVT